MFRNLKDLGELAFESTCIGRQFSNRYLEKLERHVLLKYMKCSHTEYSGFLRCSATASAVKVFPTPGLPLKIHISTNQKTMIELSYCKRITMPRPFPSIMSSNSESSSVSVRAIIVSLCSTGMVKPSKGIEDHLISSISATANSTI